MTPEREKLLRGAFAALAGAPHALDATVAKLAATDALELADALDAARSREARLVEALSLVAAPLTIDGLEHAAAVKHARAALEDGKR